MPIVVAHDPNPAGAGAAQYQASRDSTFYKELLRLLLANLHRASQRQPAQPRQRQPRSGGGGGESGGRRSGGGGQDTSASDRRHQQALELEAQKQADYLQRLAIQEENRHQHMQEQEALHQKHLAQQESLRRQHAAEQQAAKQAALSKKEEMNLQRMQKGLADLDEDLAAGKITQQVYAIAKKMIMDKVAPLVARQKASAEAAKQQKLKEVRDAMAIQEASKVSAQLAGAKTAPGLKFTVNVDGQNRDFWYIGPENAPVPIEPIETPTKPLPPLSKLRTEAEAELRMNPDWAERYHQAHGPESPQKKEAQRQWDKGVADTVQLKKDAYYQSHGHLGMMKNQPKELRGALFGQPGIVPDQGTYGTPPVPNDSGAIDELINPQHGPYAPEDFQEPDQPTYDPSLDQPPEPPPEPPPEQPPLPPEEDQTQYPPSVQSGDTGSQYSGGYYGG